MEKPTLKKSSLKMYTLEKATLEKSTLVNSSPENSSSENSSQDDSFHENSSQENSSQESLLPSKSTKYHDVSSDDNSIIPPRWRASKLTKTLSESSPDIDNSTFNSPPTRKTTMESSPIKTTESSPTIESSPVIQSSPNIESSPKTNSPQTIPESSLPSSDKDSVKGSKMNLSRSSNISSSDEISVGTKKRKKRRTSGVKKSSLSQIAPSQLASHRDAFPPNDLITLKLLPNDSNESHSADGDIESTGCDDNDEADFQHDDNTVVVLPKGDVEVVPRADVEVGPRADVEVLPRGAVEVLPRGDVEDSQRVEVEVSQQSEVEVSPQGDCTETKLQDVEPDVSKGHPKILTDSDSQPDSQLEQNMHILSKNNFNVPSSHFPFKAQETHPNLQCSHPGSHEISSQNPNLNQLSNNHSQLEGAGENEGDHRNSSQRRMASSSEPHQIQYSTEQNQAEVAASQGFVLQEVAMSALPDFEEVPISKPFSDQFFKDSPTMPTSSLPDPLLLLINKIPHDNADDIADDIEDSQIDEFSGCLRPQQVLTLDEKFKNLAPMQYSECKKYIGKFLPSDDSILSDIKALTYDSPLGLVTFGFHMSKDWRVSKSCILTSEQKKKIIDERTSEITSFVARYYTYAVQTFPEVKREVPELYESILRDDILAKFIMALAQESRKRHTLWIHMDWLKKFHSFLVSAQILPKDSDFEEKIKNLKFLFHPLVKFDKDRLSAKRTEKAEEVSQFQPDEYSMLVEGDTLDEVVTMIADVKFEEIKELRPVVSLLIGILYLIFLFFNSSRSSDGTTITISALQNAIERYSAEHDTFLIIRKDLQNKNLHKTLSKAKHINSQSPCPPHTPIMIWPGHFLHLLRTSMLAISMIKKEAKRRGENVNENAFFINGKAEQGSQKELKVYLKNACEVLGVKVLNSRFWRSYVETSAMETQLKSCLLNVNSALSQFQMESVSRHQDHSEVAARRFYRMPTDESAEIVGNFVKTIPNRKRKAGNELRNSPKRRCLTEDSSESLENKEHSVTAEMEESQLQNQEIMKRARQAMHPKREIKSKLIDEKLLKDCEKYNIEFIQIPDDEKQSDRDRRRKRIRRMIDAKKKELKSKRSKTKNSLPQEANSNDSLERPSNAKTALESDIQQSQLAATATNNNLSNDVIETHKVVTERASEAKTSKTQSNKQSLSKTSNTVVSRDVEPLQKSSPNVTKSAKSTTMQKKTTNTRDQNASLVSKSHLTKGSKSAKNKGQLISSSKKSTDKVDLSSNKLLQKDLTLMTHSSEDVISDPELPRKLESISPKPLNGSPSFDTSPKFGCSIDVKSSDNSPAVTNNSVNISEVEINSKKPASFSSNLFKTPQLNISRPPIIDTPTIDSTKMNLSEEMFEVQDSHVVAIAPSCAPLCDSSSVQEQVTFQDIALHGSDFSMTTAVDSSKTVTKPLTMCPMAPPQSTNPVTVSHLKSSNLPNTVTIPTHSKATNVPLLPAGPTTSHPHELRSSHRFPISQRPKTSNASQITSKLVLCLMD